MFHALGQNNLEHVGRLLIQSHASLRDLYEVSTPEVDWLVRHAGEIHGVYGVRLAGGSGASCAPAIASRDAVELLRERLHEYERIFGFHPDLVPYGMDDGVLNRFPGGYVTVLLTNDDGIDSAGLEALQAALSVDHDVWIIAPDGERSAMSHYITIRDPIRCRKVGEQIFSSSGSPADCVIVGMLGGLPVTPDVVVSGINLGPNLGTDIIYSGTVAAARQAAFMRTPGIAVSINTYSPPFHLDPVAGFVTEHLEEFRQLWNPRHFININAPNLEGADFPVRVTYPSWRMYKDHIERFDSPQGDSFFFLDGHPEEGPLEEGSDWHAVSEGAFSVSPIYLNPVDHHEDEAYRDALFLKTGV